MYCNKCGKQLKDDAKFCTACGNPVVRVKGADRFINMANAGIKLLNVIPIVMLRMRKEAGIIFLNLKITI